MAEWRRLVQVASRRLGREVRAAGVTRSIPSTSAPQFRRSLQGSTAKQLVPLVAAVQRSARLELARPAEEAHERVLVALRRADHREEAAVALPPVAGPLRPMRRCTNF